jgi:hypothetical protein
MVFRGLYHLAQAVLTDYARQMITYFVAHHQRLGLAKAIRKRHP